MAEYIDREKTLNELCESASYHAESGREYQLLLRDRNIIRKQPTADVIERSEYEFLKKENKELAIKYDNAMNMVINGNEQLEKLRSKIDKALKEMDNLASHKVRPISFDQSVAIDMCINILKRNIGE